MSISRLTLTMSCGDYDRTKPIINGEVVPEGMNLITIPLGSPERHRRMLVNEEFDICELSVSSYLIAFERNKPYKAIDVFPSRRFRHAYIFINRDSGIEKPKDLEGKKVGIRRFQNTAALWVRGILADEYSVDKSKIEWMTEDEEELEVTPNPMLKITRIKEGSLDDMLEKGLVDAIIYPRIPKCYREGNPKISRLFENYKKEEERYYTKTGILPIMHTLVIKNNILEKYPWVAESLKKAFEKSKQIAYQYMDDPLKLSLIWNHSLREEEEKIFGKDPFPYDLQKSRHNLETVIRYSYEDGLISKILKVDDLFYNS